MKAPVRARVVVPVQIMPSLIAALQDQLRTLQRRVRQRAARRRDRCTRVKSAAETQLRHRGARAHQHPNADTELHYRNAFELLVATILSAQSTDAGVNKVTPALFAKFPDARALAGAPAAEVEALIHVDRLLPAEGQGADRACRGRSSSATAARCPRTMEALVKLPGVGRKTANVVLGHALGVPGLPVDRHVLRVSNRLGIADSDDPERVEQQLTGALPPGLWTRASDTLILHGRRVCKPEPLCEPVRRRPRRARSMPKPPALPAPAASAPPGAARPPGRKPPKKPAASRRR